VGPRACLPARATVPSWEQSFRVLRHHGLHPVTVFDIGVAYGTYELYRAFPDAYYHLIDPTHESLHHMRQLARRLRCEIHPLALSNREGSASARPNTSEHSWRAASEFPAPAMRLKCSAHFNLKSAGP
jgi:hypothetical protein